MHVRRIASAAELDRLAPTWNTLAGQISFRRWEWLHAWWRHFGRGQELYVLAAEDAAGGLAGLAPWYLEQSTARGRVLRFLGSGEVCTDYLSILAMPAQREAVAAAMATWLAEAAGNARGSSDAWDLLELEGIDQTDAPGALLVAQLAEEGCAVHRAAGPNCWRIELPGTWDEYLNELSKSHRKQVGRSERKLAAPGFATFHTADEGTFERGYSILVDLHQRRRQALGEPGCFASASFAGFLREAAERLITAGVLELHWLDIEGQPAAAELLLTEGGIAYAYQAGVAPELIDKEPGRLMNIALLKRAIERRYRGLDLLRGDEPYKAHWRAKPRPSDVLRIVPPRASAQLRHGAWFAGDRVKQWVKSGLSLVGMH